jgi:hypothetical protein
MGPPTYASFACSVSRQMRRYPPNTGSIPGPKERRRADGIGRRSKEEERRVAETWRVFCLFFVVQRVEEPTTQRWGV